VYGRSPPEARDHPPRQLQILLATGRKQEVGQRPAGRLDEEVRGGPAIYKLQQRSIAYCEPAGLPGEAPLGSESAQVSLRIQS